MVSMKMLTATILLVVSISLFVQPTESIAKEANKAAQGTKPVSTPMPSHIPTVTNENQNQSDSPHSTKDQGSDGVHAAQPVTIGTAQDNPLFVNTVKDNWDKALVLGTILLVVVGCFGVRYAIKTLKAIDKQAELMEGQLKEMKTARELTNKQVQYIVDVERAWIIAELNWWEKSKLRIVESQSYTPTEGKTDSTTVTLKLTCKNEGKSPAWIDKVYGQLDIVDAVTLVLDPKGPVSNNSPIGVVGVGTTKERTVQLSCPGRRKNNEFLSAYVTLEYRDIFDLKRKTTLGYTIGSNGEIGRQDALPERHKNT